jgi:hypothetical protein
LAELGHAVDVLHCCVQYPPLHAVPLVVVCSVVQMPEAHSEFAVQADPTASIGLTQLPVLVLHERVEPQLQPWRQSGRHAFAVVEQM